MEYQKQKVLNEFSKRHWKIEASVTPQAENNWKEAEVIQLVKYDVSMFLSIEWDPTSSYLGVKTTSVNYDIRIYDSDPLETTDQDSYNLVAELNLGNKWQANLEKFIAQSECYFEKIQKI